MPLQDSSASPGPLSRRALLWRGALAAAAACPGSLRAVAKALPQKMTSQAYAFPVDFVWGVAASAPQIEGAAREDGKGESIWDRFAAQPGKTANGDTPAVACDHYHRYAEDFRLMQTLGMRNYRLSIAWPRVVPAGRGSVNEKGLDFYDKLIDSLHDHGITPWVTLFHWDLPQALEDEGGWRLSGTAAAFGKYAELVVKRLGDRVKRWMTLNELPSFIGLGYGAGIHAPGAREPAQVVNQCYHHALLAHGLGVKAVREHGGPGARAGLVHNPSTPVPVTETEDDITACRAEYAAANAQVLTPVFSGSYPEAWLRDMGANRPRFSAEEMRLISLRTDFLGLNLYGGSFCRAGQGNSRETLPLSPDYPRANLEWLNVMPQVMYWAVRHATEQYGAPEIYITENGCSQNDVTEKSGQVLDLGRREFYRNYLISLQRATAEGYHVKGFFAWSFMDNFEWAEGYSKRFGVVHVDYATQERTPKLSGAWYSSVAQHNRVL